MSAEATPGTRARFSSGAAEAWTAASRFAVVALMLLVIFIVTHYHPISSADFMATVCKAVGIDYTKEYIARGGRPMHKVDKGAKPVEQVF